MNEPVDLSPLIHKFGNESWEVKLMRLNAEWNPLYDEKNRRVHGWALIEVIPAHILGRELNNGSVRWSISPKPYGVRIIATRDGKNFGAIPRTKWYATHEDMLMGARKGLVQQGKRYAKKYGRTA